MAGNRYPGVYRRGKTWSWRVQFADGDDRSSLSGSGFDSAKAAYEARSKALEQARRHRHQPRPDSNLTLAEYLTSWVEDHAQTVRPSTAQAYRYRADKVLAYPIARVKLRALTPAHYRRLIADLKAEGLSHDTVMSTVRFLSTALAAGVRAGYLLDNPLPDIRISRTTPKFEPKVWDFDEAVRFLDHRRAAGDPLYLAWHLALVTGLRRGELHGIRREDLDLDAGKLHVRRQRSQVNGRIHEGPPKTAGSEASLDLDPETVELLRQHVWTSDYLVTDPRTGRPYRFMNQFQRDWHKAVASAGVTPIRFHDVRHTTSSILAALGVPFVVAKARLRHMSNEMAARYQHALGSASKDAADKIGRLLGGGA